MKRIISKAKYSVEFLDGFISIYNSKGCLLSAPLSAQLVLADGTLFETGAEPEFADNKIIVPYTDLPSTIESMALTIDLGDDEIIFGFSLKAGSELSIDTFEYLRRGKKGIATQGYDLHFSPAPRSAHGHGTTLYKAFGDASCDGYFGPPPSIMVMGNRFGKIAYSLIDLHSSKSFKFTQRLGVLVEKVNGNISLLPGDSYVAPRMMLTFPDNEWEAMEDYYQRLKAKRLISPIPIEEKNFPEWWKRFVVDSYGDQITQLQYNYYTDDDWASPDFNTGWLYKWLDEAERRLGRRDFTILIDAFWQYEWSIDPIPDKDRFPNLRLFIDEAHRRGHKVILWIVPFVKDRRTHLGEGDRTLAQRYDVLNPREKVDWTSEQIEDYLKEYCHSLFSGDEGCLDADGIKLDGAGLFPDPAKDSYSHPEKGIGLKDALRFYRLFTRTAQIFKADALVNTSVVNPFFENDVHICRLGDQSVRTEREDRARISSIMSPNMLMDSDGIFNSEFIKEDYLAATVYSVPYLYCTAEFLFGERPDDMTMRALGNLLSLSEKKPYGRPVFEGLGNWRWETRGRITAACFDYDTLVVFGDDGVGYLFSWSNGKKTIPLFGWRLKDDPKSETIVANLTAGEISTFAFE